MLKIFRQNTKVMVWIVAAALIFLFGVGSIVDLLNQKKSGRYAGEVFGKTVPFQEYNLFYKATQIFMPSEKPIEDPDLLRQYTWQNIIYSREAKREGVKVSDEEVRDQIANLLKQQGLLNPTKEQYTVWLTRTLRMNPREFEEGLREFIRIQKMLRTKIAGFIPSGTEKLKDEKALEQAAKAQSESFMKWTNEVNKKAGLKDFLALPKTEDEEPQPLPQTTP